MSTGGSGERIEVILLGPDGSQPCAPGTQQPGQPGPGGGGSQQRPSGFRSASRRNREGFIDSILHRQLQRVPYITAPRARDIVAGGRVGLEAGLRGRSRAAAMTVAARQAGPTGQAIAGVVQPLAALGGGVTLAGAAGAAGAAVVGGFAAAIAGATTAVIGLTAAYRLQLRAMSGLISTLENTGVLQALQLREQTRLQFAREVRALQMMPRLSELLAAQTTRQLSFERLQQNLSLALAESLQPIVDFLADAAEAASNLNFEEWIAGIQDIIRLVGGPVAWFFEDQVKEIMAIVRFMAQVSRQRQQQALEGRMWQWDNALDPSRASNQPFDPDSPEAELYNPAARG